MNKATIEQQLAYTFTDDQWLIQSLTHPSIDHKSKTNRQYERLEFLGDALLELVVSRELFTLFPKANEGELTRLRSALVSREHLASLAAELGWGDQLIMSPHLKEAGGTKTLSILANTFESIIGAVLMDSNYQAARRVSLRLLENSIQAISTQGMTQNPKVELLELLQSMSPERVRYEEVAQGELGAGPFRSTVYWGDRPMGEGEGVSKKSAQNAAASDALKKQAWKQQ